MGLQFGASAQVVGVYVRQFKNLHDLWLPWASRMVLVGANGVGKSNLLDCCALLMGTEQSKRLVARRVPKSLMYDISAVVRLGGTFLSEPEALRHRMEPLRAAGASDELQALIATSFSEGLVRRRICENIPGTLGGMTLVADRSQLSKTLEGLRVDQLSPEFEPLARFAQLPQLVDADPYVDIAVLPSIWLDINLQWLPATRSSSQIVGELNAAILDAAWDLGVLTDDEPRGATLFDLLSDIGSDVTSEDLVAALIRAAEQVARAELAQTMPSLSSITFARSNEPLDGDEQRVSLVEVDFGDGMPLPMLSTPVVASEEPGPSEVLSAAERRWFDEALHTAAVTSHSGELVARIISNAVWGALDPEAQASFIDRINRGLDSGKLRGHEEEIQLFLLLLVEGWDRPGDAELLQNLWSTLSKATEVKPDLLSMTRPDLEQWLARLDSSDIPLEGVERREQLTRALRDLWSLVQDWGGSAPLRVRVFDEPEAHIHSGAVARIADALTAMGREADVLVSTHHPRFIYQPGWTQFHMTLEAGRPVLRPYDPTLKEQRNEVAASLGLTAGEALAGARAILLVEGKHDLRILQEPPLSTALSAAGVVVMPMRGINQLLSSLALEYVLLLAPRVVGIMFDNDRRAPRDTHEQVTVRKFEEGAREAGLEVKRIGLLRPDIVAYLNPAAISRDFSWAPILQGFHASGQHKFKDWLFDNHQVDLRREQRINEVLSTMTSHGLSFEPELTRKVSEFAAYVANHNPEHPEQGATSQSTA